MAQLTLMVDGKPRSIEVDDPDMPLLYVLRDELQLNNPRFGCGLGQCGACTVQIDGRAVRSCITPVSSVTGNKITTLAGLGSPENPHRIQKAWIGEQVNQCGYCINGWILTAAELLDRTPKPTDVQIVGSLRSGTGPKPRTAPAIPSPLAVGIRSSFCFSPLKPCARIHERTAGGCISSQPASPCSPTSQMGRAPSASASLRRWELTVKA